MECHKTEAFWVWYDHREIDSRHELCPEFGGSCLLLFLSLWCRLWDIFQDFGMINWSLRSQAEKVNDTEFESKMNSFSLTHQYSLSHFIIFLRVLGIIWNFVSLCEASLSHWHFSPMRSGNLYTLFTPASADMLLAYLCIMEWINECMNVCLVDRV